MCKQGCKKSIFDKIIRANKSICDLIESKITLENTYDFQKIILKKVKNRKIKVLEVGCNNRPTLKKDNYDNIILDGLDPDDKLNSYTNHKVFDNFYNTSIENFDVQSQYDVIILNMILEHIRDNEIVFKKLSSLLKESGFIITHQPSNFHPFSIINRLLPHKIKLFVLKTLRPWSKVGEITGWKSYYNKTNIVEFKKLCKKNNLKIVDADFNYNGRDYFKFFVPVYLIILLYEKITELLNIRLLCSHYWVVIKHK
ncbi:MAG: hypothetical protein AMJ43_03055 [Coxiella sp. DG_40]|nr:MAG: hypothetical protein AMJ43_03055 [Coxiella sp. DG_40]